MTSGPHFFGLLEVRTMSVSREGGQGPRSSVEQFSPLAADYASSTYHSQGPDLDVLLDAANLSGTERVLDLGCGPGHAGLHLSPHAAAVVGLDPSPAMLSEAATLADQRQSRNVEWVVGTAEKIPWPNGSFDRVVSRKTVHHWTNPKRGLEEAARVMAPGGSMLMIDTVAPENEACAHLLHRVELLRDPSHVRDYSVTEWSHMLDTLGLEVTAVHLMEYRIPLEEWMARARTPDAQAAEIRGLLKAASKPCRELFEIGPSGDFTLPYALFVAKSRLSTA